MLSDEPGAFGMVNRKEKQRTRVHVIAFLVKLQFRYLTLHFGVKARGNNFKLIFTNTESRARW